VPLPKSLDKMATLRPETLGTVMGENAAKLHGLDG
jgi:hypothetical protein